MNLVDIYKKERKPEETKKVSAPDTSAKKLIDKFSIFASISTNIRFIRQDIAKLVKIQGVKPTTKNESFFLGQKEKENVYESKIQKIKSTSPTKVETKPTKTESASPFDFLKSILSLFIKGGVLTAFIGGIGSLLQDPEIRKNLKEFFVGAVEFVLKGVREITSFMGDILKDDRVIRSIIDTVSLIFNTMKDVVATIFNTEIETEKGKFSVGVILGSLVSALVAFKVAIGVASAALMGAAAGAAGRTAAGAATGAAGAATAGAGAAGVVGRVVKFVRNVGPVALLGGVLYYINSKGEGTPAPEGTPIPPGTPEVSANDIQPISGVESEVQTTPEVVKPPVSDTTKTVVNTAIAAGGAFTAYQASKAAKDVSGLVAKTGEAVLDVRTQSTGQLAKSAQTTKWGRFLAYVAKKSPQLWGKVAVKLAQSATLMTIPFAGWIAAAVNLGFSIFTAYQLYVLWKEFNDADTEESKDASSEPEQILSPEETNVTPQTTVTPTPVATSVSGPATSDMRQGRGFNRAEQTSTTPTPVTNYPEQRYSGVTFRMLTPEQQNAVMQKQFEKEGNKPGDLAYDLNNPGAMLYDDNLGRLFGATQNPTRGVGNVKGKFAQFPTLQAGFEAQRWKWLNAPVRGENKYGDLPLDKAINLWTTGKVEGTSNAQEVAGIENYKRGLYAAAGYQYTGPSETTTAAASTMPKTMAATTTSPTAMAAAPTGGQKVMTASADFSDFIRQVIQPNVNVIAPTTNNVQQPTRQVAQQSYNQPSVVDSEFMKLLVGRTVNI